MAGLGLGSKNKQKLGSNGSLLLKGAGAKQPAKRLGGVVTAKYPLNGVYTFVQRSFAPWHRFGDFFSYKQRSFHGDGRGFSLSPSSTVESSGFATARLHQYAQLDVSANSIIPSIMSRRYASLTTGYINFLGRERSGKSTIGGAETVVGKSLTLDMSGGNPLMFTAYFNGKLHDVAPAPSIHWNVTIESKFIHNSGGQYFLNVQAKVTGKNFPAYELMV